jgi:hypothetical protein
MRRHGFFGTQRVSGNSDLWMILQLGDEGIAGSVPQDAGTPASGRPSEGSRHMETCGQKENALTISEEDGTG